MYIENETGKNSVYDVSNSARGPIINYAQFEKSISSYISSSYNFAIKFGTYSSTPQSVSIMTFLT
jgi:hypothetical protein